MTVSLPLDQRPTAPFPKPPPSRAPGAERVRSRRTLHRPTTARLAATAVLLLCFAGGVWAFVTLQLNIATVVDSADNAVDFAERMLPLEFPPPGELFELTWQTLAIVIAATTVSVVLSVPLALLAAHNTTVGAPARLVSRALIVLARAIPDVVFAIAAFRVFGLGGMTGVIAMGLHSVGMVGKLYADAIEETDQGPRDALRAVGAGRLQQITGAVLPQVLPSLVATALHRLDINLRVSVVLGFVGVGGLGHALSNAISRLDYQEAMGLALVVVLLCFAAETLSGAVRRTLLPDTAQRAGPGPLRRLTARLNTLRIPRTPAAAQAPRTASASPAAQAPRARPAASVATTPAGPLRKPARIANAPAGPPHARRRISPSWDARRVRRLGWAALVAGLVGASFVRAEVSPDALLHGAQTLWPTIQDFLPPASAGVADILWEDLWITLRIALAGTLIGLVLALPLGTLAARNVVRSAVVSRFFRSLILLIRGLPELLLAIVFVVITGLGPVAGALALGIGSVGLLGKLVADSLEEIGPGPAQAAMATGAGRGQVFFAAILPRAWPTVLAHLLYTLDVNIRSATLLGVVGAGGIGYDLLNAARVQQFDVVSTIVLMILMVVLLVEGLAIWVRKIFA
ncbi:phosphonate ABC transporter, permease protein PhnE [Streptomyces zagrosensis]|uniref:Phosphonate transport system permease protein n=1 Tax=Streptomyces zagrosensis TaxID=1042984 RepID=A0A7W9UYL3_9ACTN|nr:phosphonate ABC transporter, permease protein PhnE [Streptomyces zagrosensis]MBB5935476.1 phosphonate transport system permease protein [Streptomyces zagrosensis]